GSYQPATIRGLKFLDRDGDGTRDEDEPGLAGWTIFLDQNQNGALDLGELSTTTASDGTYEFAGLTPGTYFVAEVPQEGWVQTYPTDATYAVSLSSGEVVGQVNLGNRNLPPTLTPPSNQTGLEGSGANFDLGSFTDPGAGNGPWAVQVNWGDG